MDSLTQIILGASVGAAIGGRKYGKKSAVIGGICGLIPDLDVFFLAFSDPITALTTHRGVSHSLIFALLMTPILAWLVSKIKWFGMTFKDRTLQVMIFLSLFTHALLDSFTIYGTQVLWPLSYSPTGLGSVFIIDPLYSLPLLTALIIYLCCNQLRLLKATLLFSALYLLWGIGAQYHIAEKVKNSDIALTAHQNILVQTTPFNSFLWRVLIMDEGEYQVGYSSIFDQSNVIKFKSYRHDNEALKKGLQDNVDFQRLKWFTKDFYALERIGQNIVMTDLRMGIEPQSYMFRYIIDENGNRRYDAPQDDTSRSSRLKKIWYRIWDENIDLVQINGRASFTLGG